MQRDPKFARPHEIRDTRVGDLLRAGGGRTRHKSCQYQWNPKTFFQCDSPSTEVDFELLTFALSGRRRRSALERAVRQLPTIGANDQAIHLDAFLSGSRSRYSR